MSDSIDLTGSYIVSSPEHRIAELEAEIASLRQAANERFQAQWREGVGNPFYEAAAAAADERLVALKHEARANLDRAEAGERQLAEMMNDHLTGR